MGDVATPPARGTVGYAARRRPSTTAGDRRPRHGRGALLLVLLTLAFALTTAGAATAQLPGAPGQDIGVDEPGSGGDGDGFADGGATDLIGDFLFEPVFEVGPLDVTGLHLVAGLGLLGIVGLGAALGVKHVTPDNALEHEDRAGLFQTIRTQPGIHLRELARSQDMAVTSATWHLKKLQDVGLVRSAKLEGYKVFYPAQGGREAKRLTVATKVLDNDNAGRILRYVSAHPGSYQRQIAEELGLNHATVRWHLQKLGHADLVTEVPLSHVTQYYLSAEGFHALRLVEGPDGQEGAAGLGGTRPGRGRAAS